MSAILVAVFDFFMASLVYIGLLIYYGYGFSLESQYLIPLALLLTVIATFGLGNLIAPLNVECRDFRYLLPFTIQVLLFPTPVIYPISMVDRPWLQKLLAFNPMSAPIYIVRKPRL